MRFFLQILIICFGVVNANALFGQATDYDRIETSIRGRFSGFFDKSQFETEKDYESRIKDQRQTAFNNIVTEVIAESKSRKTEPYFVDKFSGWAEVQMRYDAENEVFNMDDGVKLPVPKSAAEAFYNNLKNKQHKILVIPQKVEMVNYNWRTSSVIILFDLYSSSKITPQLNIGIFSVLDYIDTKRVDTKNKFCYIQRYKSDQPVRLAIKNIRDMKLAGGKLPEHIYYYEWKDTSINPDVIQSLVFVDAESVKKNPKSNYNPPADGIKILKSDEIRNNKNETGESIHRHSRYQAYNQYSDTSIIRVEKRDRETTDKGTLESQMSGLFGNGTGSGNRGNTDQPGTQPVQRKTSGVGGWASYDIGGRSIGRGGLIRPDYSAEDYGVVVVDVIVNPKGVVIEATIGKGTNTSNENLRRESLRAATKTRFNEIASDINQKGKITYKFNLN